MNRGPCAKKHVVCTIVSWDGRTRVIGDNSCANPQPVCPREPGEGYEKCKSICKQLGHAEDVALQAAIPLGVAKGGHAYVEGHTYACRDCQEKLFGAGIEALSIGPPPPAPPPRAD